MKNKLTKYGLTGNSGFGTGLKLDGIKGAWHVSANYAANGENKVFVMWNYKDGISSWKRMTIKRAKREGRKIIPCCQCDKPAVTLDHCWPYLVDRTFCSKHDKVFFDSIKITKLV